MRGGGGGGGGGGGKGQKDPTPVIIVETLVNFFFPLPSMLILKMFMLKQTHETNMREGEGSIT